MQEAKNIQTLKVRDLRQTEALGFFQRVFESFKTCETASFKPLFKQFEEDVTAFLKAVNPQSSNATTEPLTEADIRRDNALSGLFGYIKLMKKHFDADKKEAACRVQTITKKYANIAELPYIQENGKILALFRDLMFSSAETVKDIEKIGAEDWITELMNANEAFMTLFDKRNAEDATRISGQSLDCRRVCENSYRLCVDMINALITVNGAEAYKTLVDDVNNLIAYQKQVLATRETRNNKEEQ